MSTSVRDGARAPGGLRWRVVAVSALVTAVTAAWLLGGGTGRVAAPLERQLAFAFALGAGLYLAIVKLTSWAVQTAPPATAAGSADASPGRSRPHAGSSSPARPVADSGSGASAAALHDVRNVLAAIGGHAELALRKLEPGVAARSELEGIALAVERCARLTRHAAPEPGERIVLPRPLELNTIVLDMRPMLARLLGERIDLVVVTGASRSLLLGELAQIERLILNLAVNARDAMPDGGVLRILTENVERPPDPEHSDPGGLGVALVVQDTGRGMDAATRARMFEPGFSAGPGGHSGLGLAIVQEAARQSSARIDCQTAPERGTTFRVVFPLALGPAPRKGAARGAPAADRPAPSRGPDRRNRVLVIDDDAEVRRVVQGLLESAGFQVMTAPDGAQALALLELRMADAALCDIFMPNKEGIETCTELRRRYPALRVVAMSGAAGASGYLRAAEKLGAVASLRKPFTGQELVAVLQGALAGRTAG